MSAIEFDARIAALGGNLIWMGWLLGFDPNIGGAVLSYGIVGVMLRLAYQAGARSCAQHQ